MFRIKTKNPRNKVYTSYNSHNNIAQSKNSSDVCMSNMAPHYRNYMKEMIRPDCYNIPQHAAKDTLTSTHQVDSRSAEEDK